MIVLDLSILNQKGTPMFNSDIFANRPAFGIVGRIFISTDTAAIYRDTGTAWDLIADGGSASTNIYNSNGTLSADRTLASGGFNLTFNPSTTFDTTLTAANNASSLALFGVNRLSYAAAFSANNIGSLYGGASSFALQTFAGSATFANSNVASGGSSVNSIDFSSGGSTITMTQSTGIRAMTGQQNLFQYQGTNSGTITHAAISQNTGFYRPSAATGILTITNAYSHLINALDDYGAGFTFTNRFGIYQAGASDINYFAGQTLIGSAVNTGGGSGKLIVGSSTADNGIQIFGANSPSLRIDNAQSGGTQRFIIGLATSTNNFIQGATAGQFCITTASSGAILFGMWQSINASEVMRISTASNLIVGSTTDNGQKLQITGDGYFSANVGIGISAPLTYKTSIYKNGAGILDTLILNNAHQTIGVIDGVKLTMREFNIESSSTYGSANNILTFGYSTNKQLTLTEAGNFGINTTTPGEKLVVSGGMIWATGLLANTANLSGVGIWGGNNGGQIFARGSAGLGSLSLANSSFTFFNATGSTGNVQINSTTDSGQKLQVTGDAFFTHSGNTLLTLNSTFSTGYTAIQINSSGVAKGLIGFGSFLTTDAGFAIRTASGVPFTVAVGGGTPNLTIATTGAATFNSSIAIANSVAAAVAVPSTHKVSILIGGVQYYLLASNV